MRKMLCGWLWLAGSALAAPPAYQLGPEQLGVVINAADPLSREIADYYVKRHGVPQQNVVAVTLPADRVWITEAELAQARARVDEAMPAGVQALALTWAKPYRVNCLGITYGFTAGYVPGVCEQTCKPTPLSKYFNSPAVQPHRELGWRPSMMVAAESLPQAKALIDRGAAAWGSHPLAAAYFVRTGDKARDSRAPLFPRAGRAGPLALRPIEAKTLTDRHDVMIYQIGAIRVADLDTLTFVPGALADHLTSTGGQLTDSRQMSSLAWLNAGATASYGTVSEPCSHPQKFPHPQVLLAHYLVGATAVEAYWKSVAWPAQGVFVGDPLAAPYRRTGPLRAAP
ncbi:TIGR03790 family protein [Chitiniphilus purpureus]|uniref:TIGR03790 family protein n=1 Tax=Chitiniphilus purpureus TaxID=2981137 RepID=A0ABY6DIK8_9NEIS|nr:TIGR03790 family protein [Chitiniphilus sp. CD1]UXY14073.1 TIGR03790 family protein [Chitiniphilus sp. CD1]